MKKDKRKDEQEKQQKMRRRIAEEILETEQAYVKNLRLLCELYLDPLSNKKQILKPDEIRVIFSVIETIKSLNVVLEGQLAERMKTWGPQAVWEIYLTKIAHFSRCTAPM